MKGERFFFGVPLIARASARDWAAVQALLGLTLTSLRAQTEADIEILIAGHDRPDLPLDDATFLAADWPAEAVRADNLDAGRKKFAMQRHVLERGGGLLMFVDADDWVDRRTVAAARAEITREHVGALVETGYATDLLGLRAAPLPHPRVFDKAFHEICGSSTVARLDPSHPDPARRDPHSLLHEHYRWRQVAGEHGLAVARLPVEGSYVVNTSVNHSETHGPFADWRRDFNASVRREGQAADAEFLARFGLSPEDVDRARERLR
jgi:hypothetical protein